MDALKAASWRDLKKVANEIPEELLDKPIIIWSDTETSMIVGKVDVLEEDYLYDGDEGCAPASDFADIIKENDALPEEDRDSFDVAYPKGTAILWVEM